MPASSASRQKRIGQWVLPKYHIDKQGPRLIRCPVTVNSFFIGCFRVRAIGTYSTSSVFEVCSKMHQIPHDFARKVAAACVSLANRSFWFWYVLSVGNTVWQCLLVVLLICKVPFLYFQSTNETTSMNGPSHPIPPPSIFSHHIKNSSPSCSTTRANETTTTLQLCSGKPFVVFQNCIKDSWHGNVGIHRSRFAASQRFCRIHWWHFQRLFAKLAGLGNTAA